MPDPLDDRVRDLFAEADSASPQPPPMPSGKAPARPWIRWIVVPAATTLALFVGVVAVLNATGFEFGLGFAASSDSSDVTFVEASAGLDYVDALADLNLACAAFRQGMSEAGIDVADAESVHDYLINASALFVPLSELVDEVSLDFPEEVELRAAATRSASIGVGMDAALALSPSGMMEARQTLLEELRLLGSELEAAGAIDCAALP